MFTRLPVIFLACAVALALLTGGMTHASIPHDHGHTHEATFVWQDLHAALRHDEKYLSFVPTLAVAVFGLLLFAASLHTYPLRRLGTITTLDPVRGRALRRGIVPHRTFG